MRPLYGSGSGIPRLKVGTAKYRGAFQQRWVQLLYVEDLVHEELLIAVKERLESFTVDGILDSGMLEQLTERSLVFAFSTVSDNRTSGPGGTGTSQWKSRAAL